MAAIVPVKQYPAISVPLLLALSSTAHGAPAVNQFEIKDLEMEVGQWEFQSQNAHIWGHPNRRYFRDDDDVEYDDISLARQRHALEIEVGTVSWMRNRIGVEFEKERLDDPAVFSQRDDFESLNLDEIAVEAVVSFIPQARFGIGVGFLVEYQYAVEPEESDSIVFGPIFERNLNNWSFIVNPALVQFFGGDDNDEKLDFTYGAHLIYTRSANLDLGIELYGTLDRLGATGNPSEEATVFGDHDLHRIGPIAYFRYGFAQGFQDDNDGQLLTIGIGLFFGLNEATPDYTFKWSVEFEF